ncbi:hypothetical protein BGC07_09645 [Piscirickettsia litoralis]|uniref:Uncharacterized protein n=1 Tax=Piscirickettsia litoralis TaxID=1891921 RepID=A0ABX3A3M6_9GAMM|nr:hypothetical protein BGC07_09645 [Piscirickettsia litoralis]
MHNNHKVHILLSLLQYNSSKFNTGDIGSGVMYGYRKIVSFLVIIGFLLLVPTLADLLRHISGL